MTLTQSHLKQYGDKRPGLASLAQLRLQLWSLSGWRRAEIRRVWDYYLVVQGVLSCSCARYDILTV
jgi:hypothetical protein